MSSSRVNLEKCRIPLEEIIRATKNFSSETKVGDGGFGIVYRGQLSEHWKNRLVAIKRLHPDGCQGNIEFTNELEMVSNFNHPNIIPFIGYCDDANEKIVVYEYAANISLEHHLQDPNKRRCLTWAQRLKICLGAARGIMYLHAGVGEYTRVIHRDVKSANILLDENLEAKICDIGLSRLSPRNQPATDVCTRAYGTRFYIDPIYNERGRLSKESDIYSFGVVMFEMSSGMMAYNPRRFDDTEKQYLIDIVRSYYEDNQSGLHKLIDTTIEGQIDMRSFHIFNDIAHQCINLDKMKRPTIDSIIEGLQEALDTQETSGEEFYMVRAKDLLIEWQYDTRYWEWGYIPESRFQKVWILIKVCNLTIDAKIAVVTLSQKGKYAAYLVFRTTEECWGLDVPAKSKVSFGGIEMETENVYLQRPRDVEENYVAPRWRKDGRMEIKLGEFKYKEGDDGEVEIAFKGDTVLNWKSGLIVEGIEIRPILPFQRADGPHKLVGTTIEGLIGVRSLHVFNDIAHQCINLDKMKRPTIDWIVEGLKEALQEALDTQETSGEEFYIVGAKDLLIEWQYDTRYWEWGHIPESRFRKVWILRKVCNLRIEATIAAVSLSQNGTYVAYLVFRTSEDCYGLDVPAKSKVSFGGIVMDTENVYLQRPRDVQENYVVPHKRNHWWMEIKFGEFEYKEGDDGEVEMMFKQDTLHWKSGLFVEGIEIRPILHS